MFTPQEYMKLVVDKDRITISRELFSMVLDSEYTTRHSSFFIRIYEFFNRYKSDIGILIQNDVNCIDFFRDMVDEGERVPGYVMLFEDYIFIKVSSTSNGVGIRRLTPGDANKEKENENVHFVPDIRELLNRV